MVRFARATAGHSGRVGPWYGLRAGPVTAARARVEQVVDLLVKPRPATAGPCRLQDGLRSARAMEARDGQPGPATSA